MKRFGYFYRVIVFLILFNGLGARGWGAVSSESKIEDLTLSTALKLADQRQLDRVIANERVQQAVARLQASVAPLLPQLTGVISETRQTRDLRSFGFSFVGSPLVGPFNVFDARVQLTQIIFDAQAFARFDASRHGRTLSWAEARKAKEDSLVLVANLFIEARRAETSLDVYQAMFRRDKKQLAITHSRLKSGLSSSLELKKARAAYAKSFYNYETSKAQTLQRRLDLFAAIGLDHHKNYRLIWDQDLFTKKIIVDVVVPVDQPDIAVAREDLHFKQAQHRVDVGGYWPKLSLVGDYGPSGRDPYSENFSETYALGVKAIVPIFEGRALNARMKESSSQVRVSEATLQDTQRHVDARVKSAAQNIDRAAALLVETTAESAVGHAEWFIAKQKYKTGNGSDINVTNALVQYLDKKDQEDEAQAYYFLTQINYARSLGKVHEFLMTKNP